MPSSRFRSNASCIVFRPPVSGMICENTRPVQAVQLLSQPPHASCLRDGEIVLRLHLPTPCSPADASVPRRTAASTASGDLTSLLGVPLQSGLVAPLPS